jgi:hypothetical protein
LETSNYEWKMRSAIMNSYISGHLWPWSFIESLTSSSNCSIYIFSITFSNMSNRIPCSGIQCWKCPLCGQRKPQHRIHYMSDNSIMCLGIPCCPKNKRLKICITYIPTCERMLWNLTWCSIDKFPINQKLVIIYTNWWTDWILNSSSSAIFTNSSAQASIPTWRDNIFQPVESIKTLGITKPKPRKQYQRTYLILESFSTFSSSIIYFSLVPLHFRN